MNYNEIAKSCEQLGYRDKLRLSQLLIQFARKEEEGEHPQIRTDRKKDTDSIEYVAKRILRLKPAKKKTLANSIRAMFQFQGGVSGNDEEKIIADLQRLKYITIAPNNRVTYLK